MSLIRKHGAVLQAWACLDLVYVGSPLANSNFAVEEEEEEIYLAQNQRIKCKNKSYTIQSRVTGKPEGQLCRPP